MSFTYSLTALPWDIAIFLLIALGIAVTVFAWKWIKRNPFHPLRRWMFMLAGLAVLEALTVFYGSFIEPQIITVTERTITLPAEEEMTIVVLSDFHVGPYKGQRFVRRVAEKVQALEPDLVLLVGDFIYYGNDPLDHLTPLGDLSPRYGTFAVLGNHEYSCYGGNIFSRKRHVGFDQSLRVRRALERIGMTVLRNEWKEVAVDSGLLLVAGVDDSCTGRDRIKDAVPEIRKGAPILLLSHNPDIILEGRIRRPHLVVSGHTHGGQIRLPFIGPLALLPTQLGQDYDQGLFPIDDDTVLAITRGIGESGARARLFAPPEILVLRARGDIPAK